VGPHYPGSELIGTFDFTAFVPPPESLPAGSCTFTEMPTVDFTFTGTFSRNADGETFFTLGNTNRSATFDGQFASSSQSAPRTFEKCACVNNTTVAETLTVALLSRSQVDTLPDPNQCPPSVLDGGVPPIDGGVTGPGSTDAGFDAVLACGLLLDTVEPGEGCMCDQCSVSYAVHGDRR
jgi:hypothetical protein